MGHTAIIIVVMGCITLVAFIVLISLAIKNIHCHLSLIDKTLNELSEGIEDDDEEEEDEHIEKHDFEITFKNGDKKIFKACGWENFREKFVAFYELHSDEYVSISTYTYIVNMNEIISIRKIDKEIGIIEHPESKENVKIPNNI